MSTFVCFGGGSRITGPESDGLTRCGPRSSEEFGEKVLLWAGSKAYL